MVLGFMREKVKNKHLQKLNSAAQNYGASGTTIASENSTTEEYTTTDASVEQNNSGGAKSIRSQLKELKSLFEDELISEDDYNAKKQQNTKDKG